MQAIRMQKAKKRKDEDRAKLAAWTYLLSMQKGRDTESDFANRTWGPSL